MENRYVNGDTLIGEVVNQYPETAEILMNIGMHCLGCPASQAESVADASRVHGMDPQTVVDSLNAKIAERKGVRA